jgi:hypothetical protein
MDNKKVISFLRFLGVQLNAKDVAAINAKVTANAFPGAEPPVDDPAAMPPAEPSEASNVELLDQLITDLGGFEAFKAILLKVVEATTPVAEEAPKESPITNAKKPSGKNRDLVIASLVSNSKGALTFADLKGMDDDTLAAMSSLIPQPAVDFSATSVNQNAGGVKPLVRPKFLTAKKSE